MALIAALSVSSMSCAPRQRAATEPADPSTFVGPVSTRPTTPTQAESEKTPSAVAATSARESTPQDRRDDGRPTWWIDDLKREHGEIYIAAEALAPDLRAARRAAIDAGVARLTRELGAPPKDWVVKAAMIRPLRAVRGPESVNRFVGYVLIAAAE